MRGVESRPVAFLERRETEVDCLELGELRVRQVRLRVEDSIFILVPSLGLGRMVVIPLLWDMAYEHDRLKRKDTIGAFRLSSQGGLGAGNK